MLRQLSPHHFLRIAFFALLGIYLAVGLPHLGKFQTADEDLWFANPEEGRVHQYWDAWRHHAWEETRINDKPGVTTAILSGMFGPLYDRHPSDKLKDNDFIVTSAHPAYFKEASFFYRIGIYLANGALIWLIGWLLWRITRNPWLSFFAAAFLFLSPILIGVSQLVNPDATLWSFGTASLLAYVAFVLHGRWRYAILSGALLGMTLLSKYTGAILFFLLYLTAFASLLFLHADTSRETFRRIGIMNILGYLLVLLLSLAVFALLMPAALIDPRYLWEGTFGFKGAANTTPVLALMGGILLAFLSELIFLKARLSHTAMHALRYLKTPLLIAIACIITAGVAFTLLSWSDGNRFGFETAPFDTSRGSEYTSIQGFWNQLALQTKPLVFTTPPAVLLFALLGWLLGAIPALRKHALSNKHQHAVVFLLFLLGSLIILFFYAAFEQHILVHVRYSILLYPAVAIAAAIGAALALHTLPKRHTWMRWGFASILLLWSALSLAADRPFHFNYTNDLLPRNDDVTGAWGYGGYEAAQFLNTRFFSEYALAWSDYEGFCPFFHGRCIKGSIVKWYKGGDFKDIDYFVASRRGLIRNESIWRKLKRDVVHPEPIWTLYIGGRPGNFVEVYKKREPL